MQRSDVPTKFPIPFANGASGIYIRPIPLASQIGIEAGAASLTDGFPPVTFDPLASGGVPPWGADFNGLENQITGWVRWLSCGVPVTYDGAFQSAIGGYPQGALLVSASVAGRLWVSLTDNNTTNPDTGGAGWRVSAPYRCGEMFWWPTATPPAYALACDGAAYSRTGIAQGLWLMSGSGAPPFTPGNGTTTFTVPDFRGYFVRAWDNSAGIDPGRAIGTEQDDAFKSHTHNVPVHVSDSSGNGAADGSSTVTNNPPTSATGDTETRPKNIAAQLCICL